jgi:hypothetical protein
LFHVTALTILNIINYKPTRLFIKAILCGKATDLITGSSAGFPSAVKNPRPSLKMNRSGLARSFYRLPRAIAHVVFSVTFFANPPHLWHKAILVPAVA